MQTLRTLLWTCVSVALGIAMATVSVAGSTPWEHLKKAWATQVTASRVDNVRGAVNDAVDGMKDAMGGPSRPRERHSPQDKRALSQLVAERAKPVTP